MFQQQCRLICTSKQETGNRKKETGNRKQETGNVQKKVPCLFVIFMFRLRANWQTFRETSFRNNACSFTGAVMKLPFS